MRANAVGKGSEPATFSRIVNKIQTFLRRKIWLPKLVYHAIPYFYLVAGCAAFLATFYVAEWFWVLPHYLLFSFASLHLGITVYRRRGRRTSRPNESEPSGPGTAT